MTTRCGNCKGYVSWFPLLEQSPVPPHGQWCSCECPTEDFEPIEREGTMSEITLGVEVLHGITGYSGIVISKTVYLHGSSRICVQAPGLFEGSPIEAEWFEEDALIEVDIDA